jgi:DNA (cytosine-5)-methyltransferase 1
VELCAGLGGMGIGLRALGFNVAKAYDSWDQAVAVYNHNFSGDTATRCNLLTNRGRSTVTADKKQIGDVELMAAGPPCKGFSQLRNGRHDGGNGHNRVLAVMPDYVAILKPRIFVIENVPELLRHRRGRTFEELLQRLRQPSRRLSYRVEYGVFDAALFALHRVL